MHEIPKNLIREFIAEQRLPPAYEDQAQSWFLPLAWRLRGIAERSDKPVRIGVSGAQGSGKSTLAAFLSRLLASWGVRAAALSLDDFYLTRAQRRKLAESTHPLLATRGVPGTHDVDLLADVLDQLRHSGKNGSVTVPVFDKSRDDRGKSNRREYGRPHLILLEGWFVGLAPQQPDELEAPINPLESGEDANGAWRRFVNERLAEYHDRVFSGLDYLAFLQAPDFASVYRWRGLQERKLREKAGLQAGGVMSEAQLQRFISHYERLTRHALHTLPERADWLYVLDEEQRIVARVDRIPGQALSAREALIKSELP